MIHPRSDQHHPIPCLNNLLSRPLNINPKPAFKDLDVLFLIRVEVQGRFLSGEGDEVGMAKVERDFEGEGKSAVRLARRLCREELGGYRALEAEKG